VTALQTGRVVVTGAAGFIGSHLAEALLDLDFEVVGIDAFTASYAAADKRANIAGLLGRPGFRLFEGDLSSMDIDPLLGGVEVVFHQAAQAGVRSSWGHDFDRYVRDNVIATQRLLEACVRTGVQRLVAASSSSVYGDAPTYPTTEASVTRPVSPYGVTKLASEHLCLAYAQLGASASAATANAAAMTVATLRYFTVYGPRQRPDMAFRRFFQAAYTGEPITVYGDGEQTRDFTFVGDAVRANLLAMTAPFQAEAVNVGGGRRVTLNEVLDLIGRITGRRPRIERLPSQPGDARHTGADGARAEALLGYRPEVDLETGLAREAAWVASLLGVSTNAGGALR
jgi:nucleoside-diphosphate-sugar epimerase